VIFPRWRSTPPLRHRDLASITCAPGSQLIALGLGLLETWRTAHCPNYISTAFELTWPTRKPLGTVARPDSPEALFV
jgi:hypothetical protein